MKLQNVSRKNISYVELERDGKTPIGISVKDGSKYGLRPLIKNIKYQSLSQRSHCVAEGDVILSISGEDSKGMSRKDVRRRLKEAGSCIEMKLEYEIHEACFDNFGIYHYDRMSFTLKKESGSFGFILRKNDSASAEYPTITNIRPGGPADKEKRLKDGDRLLNIDDQSLSWLSLRDVSNILREKQEATFLIEYNTGIVDFCMKIGEKTEVEIDCPDADIGMVLGLSVGDSKLSIQDIRQGSLAQRCGAFHVGDVILQIDDIDTALLTASKANSLLQRFKKEPRKLVFIPYIGREQGRLSKSNDTKKEKASKFSPNTSLKVHHLQVPTMHQSLLRNQSATPIERIQNTSSRDSFYIHPNHPRFLEINCPVHNSPSSTHKTVFETNNLSHTPPNDFNVHDFQTKTITMFRDIVQNISTMQHFISYFDNEAERIAEKDVDTSEVHSVRKQHFTNLDCGRFSQLKAIFTQMKNSAYAFSMHIARNFKIFPWHLGDLSPITSRRNNLNDSITTINLIHQITGDLTEIQLKQFITKHYVDKIAARLDAVDMDCWECHKTCLSAVLLTQKILLFLSFNEPDLSRYVIQTFIEELMKLKIPCDDCKRPWCSVSQTEEQSAILQNIPPQPNHPLNSMPPSRSRQDPLKTSTESPLTTKPKCLLDSSIGINARTNNAYFELGQPRRDLGESQSASESDSHTDNASESNDATRLFARNRAMAQHNIHTGGDHDWVNRYKNVKKKDKGLDPSPMKTWKSNEIISAARCEFETPTLTRAKSLIPRNCGTFEEKRQEPCERTAGHPSFSSDASSEIAESFASDATIQSTISIPANKDPIPKTQRNTTIIKLRNEGIGFGLDFEFRALSESTPMVPVITAVHNPSAAQKCGILLKGDRILEINGRNLVGLAVSNIQDLMKEAFAADQVLLKVEFDVAVTEIKFGTFEVSIDKTIKPGLEFREFQKGSPLVVKGVVKGSAAHRSGLLFPGDEILFTNCIRQEAYESFTCGYKRTEIVTLTVRREPEEDVHEAQLETDIELESIPFHPRDSISRDFILYRTLVRTVNGNDARVLDHEFTLFRDPIQRDFGFLVGQNPTSGKVYITGVRPGGPADKSKVAKKNDRILEVNGTIIGRNNKNSVLSMLMQDNDRIDLITRRILRDY